MLINASLWFLTVESGCDEGFTGNDAGKPSFIVKDEAESDCVVLRA